MSSHAILEQNIILYLDIIERDLVLTKFVNFLGAQNETSIKLPDQREAAS